MKVNLLIFITLILVSHTILNADIHHSIEDEIVPSYQGAIVNVERTKGYSAESYIQKCSVFNKKLKLLGFTNTEHEISRSNIDVEYSIVNKTTKGDPGISLQMDLGIPADPSDIFEDFDKWVLDGDLNNSDISIWRSESTEIPTQKAIIWVDENNNIPLKAKFYFQVKYFFKTHNFELQIDYSPSTYLPLKSTLRTSGSNLLRKRYVVIETVYSNWLRSNN